jgi:hypothetical protein
MLNLRLFKEAEQQSEKGNKAAGTRARKSALELISCSRISEKFLLKNQRNSRPKRTCLKQVFLLQ